jgi:membrane protein
VYQTRPATFEPAAGGRWFHRIIHRYDKSNANNWATLIAWNVLFAFIPILAGLVAIFSLALNQRGFNAFVASHIAAVAHTRAERISILQSMSTFKAHAGELLAGVLVAMLWSGSSLFSTLDNALSHIFGVHARPFIRKRLRGMAMVFVFAVLLVPLLATSSLISLAHRYGFFPNLSSGTIFVIQLVVGLTAGFLLFLLIYRTMPNRRLRLTQILPGAVFADIFLELLSLIFPLYIKSSSDFTNYGLIAGLILVTITFFYLLAQIVVLGAIVIVERDPLLRQIRSETVYGVG